jgi:hypothetical protein
MEGVMFDKDTCDMKIQNHLAEIECSCPKYDMLLYYCQKDPFQLIDLSDAEPHLQILHHYQVLTHIISPKHHNQRISTQGSNLDIAKLYCPWRIVSKIFLHTLHAGGAPRADGSKPTPCPSQSSVHNQRPSDHLPLLA